MPNKSTRASDEKIVENEGPYAIDKFDGIADHKVYQLVVGPDNTPYDGTKSIK